MYDFVDQPVDRLCNGGRFLLWAMRGWACAMGQGTCPPVALTRGFAGVAALSALPDFHMVMAVLNRDALEKLAFAPMSCLTLADDEALLVALWRDAAQGRSDRLEATLALVIEEDSVVPVARSMTIAADRLAIAGLALSDMIYETQKETK